MNYDGPMGGILVFICYLRCATVPLALKNPYITYYQLRVYLLKDAKKEVQFLVYSFYEVWEKVRCGIMGDGWTYNRQRTLINYLMVYYP